MRLVERGEQNEKERCDAREGRIPTPAADGKDTSHFEVRNQIFFFFGPFRNFCFRTTGVSEKPTNQRSLQVEYPC